METNNFSPAHTLSRKNRVIAVALIVFIQLLLSLLWLRHAPLIAPDTMTYVNPAYNILGSGFFSYDGITAEYYRTPGYSVFLALLLGVYGNFLFVCIVQVMLILAASLIIFKTVLLQTKNDILSLFTMALFGLDTSLYLHAAYILADILFVFLITLSLYTFCLWRKEPEKLTPFVIMTILALASLMVKSAMMYLTVLIIPVLLVSAVMKKTAMKHTLVYIVLFTVVFGGWSLRNYIHSGYFIFSTIRNVQFYLWDAQHLMSEIDGISIEEASEALNRMYIESFDEQADLNAVEISFRYKEIGNEYILSNIAGYLKMNVRGLINMATGSGYSAMDAVFRSESRLIAAAFRIITYVTAGYILVLFISYAAGFIKGFIKKKLTYVDIILFFTVCYLAAGHASLGYERYRLTFYPLMVAAAAFLWKDDFERLTDWLRKKMRQQSKQTT